MLAESATMYSTFVEVVKAVREKYANATELSMIEGTGNCFYSHSRNGIGCAIGCLFPADVAERLDTAGRHSDDGKPFVPGISSLLVDDEFAPVIRQTISPLVTSGQLATLQYWHDEARDVKEFLSHLDNYLDEHA
jgi:hypothetical protein